MLALIDQEERTNITRACEDTSRKKHLINEVILTKKTIILFLLFTLVNCISAGARQTKQPSNERRIVVLLAGIKPSGELMDTVHENKKVLKAIGLFLQMRETNAMCEEAMILRLDNLFDKAGWAEGIPVISIKRVKDKLYLVGVGAAASSQPSSLYLYYDSAYHRIATGQTGLIQVIDYRLIGNKLGVIFNRMPGSTAFQPGFALLSKKDDKWNTCWTPEREKTWIDADGQVKFLKDNLSLIEVKGSSFGLPAAKKTQNDVFPEDHVGMHRFFLSVWEKEDCTYARRTMLPHDAPFYDKLWEMTDFSPSLSFYTPYATVFEFIRRLREGEDDRAAQLSSKIVVDKAKEYGLAEAFDSRGKIIYYHWEPGYSTEEENKISEKHACCEVDFFYREGPLERFAVFLKPIPLPSDQLRWQIADLKELKDNNKSH